MPNVYNSWSDVEENLLLHYVIDGIQSGNKIGDLITAFSETYMVTRASVSNRWQLLAKKHELLVTTAKLTWVNWVKPEQTAKLKAEKAEAKRLERVKKQTVKSREQWRKKKAKLVAKGEKVQFQTNKAPKPSDRSLYVIDNQGLVTVRTSQLG